MITVDTRGTTAYSPLIPAIKAMCDTSPGETIEIIMNHADAFQNLKEYLSDPELSLNAIADLLGVGANTVGQYAKKNGIDVKKRRKASCYSCGADKSEGKTAYYKRRVHNQ